LAGKSANSKKEQILLVNIMEEFVKRKVKESIKTLGACNCETCCLNACALALNELKPNYVTTTKGALLSQITALQLENQTNILVVVTKAVMHVMKYPRH